MFNIELDKINAYLTQKQHLTDETRSGNIIQVVKDISCLHATNPTTPYLSLFARMREFEKQDLEEELYIKRTLGKIRYVRTTVYILLRGFIPTAFAATRKIAEPKSEAYSKFLGIGEKEYKETSKRIVELLKGRGGKTAKSIKEELGTRLNVSPIVNLMCDQGLLIRGAPEKSWKSNLHTYHLLNEYLQDIKLEGINELDARRAVIEEYIASFGPVTEADITWWTGFPRSQIRQILQDVENKLACIENPTTSKTYLVLGEQTNSLMSPKQMKKDTVNLLPELDPYLMGYKERDRYLESKNRDYVFDRAGNATSTILLNGEIAGVWDVYEYPKPVVKFFLFRDLHDGMVRSMHATAKRMGRFITEKEPHIKECDSMTPLIHRTAGGVMSPLKDS